MLPIFNYINNKCSPFSFITRASYIKLDPKTDLIPFTKKKRKRKKNYHRHSHNCKSNKNKISSNEDFQLGPIFLINHVEEQWINGDMAIHADLEVMVPPQHLRCTPNIHSRV